MKKVKLLPFLGLVVLAACTSSRVTHSWRSDYPAKSYSKILVVAISAETDMVTRQRMEDHLTGDLKDQGYNAVAASAEYGPKAFRQMSEEAVVEKIQNSGFDAVVTIV